MQINIISFLIGLGVVAFIILPIRIWQLYRKKPGRFFSKLHLAARLLFSVGLIVQLVACLLWLAVPAGFLICPPWQAHCKLSALLPLLFIGPAYVLLEPLLLPVTLHLLTANQK